jgi:Arc/MetJ-type ribon-helix-helix transcriptional regulator
MSKERVTVTVDKALVKEAAKAVASGRAASLSGWVNLALTERVSKERRLDALARAIRDYESEFGTMSEEEIRAQRHRDRTATRAVRGRRTA